MAFSLSLAQCILVAHQLKPPLRACRCRYMPAPAPLGHRSVIPARHTVLATCLSAQHSALPLSRPVRLLEATPATRSSWTTVPVLTCLPKRGSGQLATRSYPMTRLCPSLRAARTSLLSAEFWRAYNSPAQAAHPQSRSLAAIRPEPASTLGPVASSSLDSHSSRNRPRVVGA